MSRRFPLRLPDSIRRAAEDLARQDGVSLNQFVATAVAEKVSALHTAIYSGVTRHGPIERSSTGSSLASAVFRPVRATKPTAPELQSSPDLLDPAACPG